MDCRAANELLGEALTGRLDEAQRAALESHLADCEACRATRDALREQDDHLRAAFRPLRRAAADVSDRVIESLAAQRVSPPERSREAPARRGLRSETFRLALATAAGFWLAWFVLRTPDRQAAPTAARVTLATGSVELRSGASAWRAAQPGAAIAAGEQVRTPPGVRCELRTDDGNLMLVNDNTELKFADERKVEVSRGQVWVAAPATKRPLQVVANRAVFACPSSGQFDLTCQPNEATLTVTGGQAQVEADGENIAASTGGVVSVADGAVTGQGASNPLLATRWIHGLLMLKGYDNPELNQRVDQMLAALGQTKLSYLYEEEIRALGDFSVPPLMEYVKSRASLQQPDRRVEAMRILADLAQPWSIGDLIELLGDQDGAVRFYAAAALKRLTGRTQGREPEQWRSESWGSCQPARDAWQAWRQANREQASAWAVGPPRKK